MAKVYFNYGTMGSAKSAQLIMNAYQYNEKGLKVLAMTPLIGCREDVHNSIHLDISGNNKYNTKTTNIESRLGISLKAFAIENVDDITMLRTIILPDVVFIDEVQFIDDDMVEELFVLATMFDIPVHCYGLLTDSSTKMFSGSKRLIELGATLNHIKSIGSLGETPVINAKIIDDIPVITDPNDNNVQVGREETYKAITIKEYLKIKKHLSDECRTLGYMGYQRSKFLDKESMRVKEIITK